VTDLSIVIPTQGRETLRRCLASMRPEHHGGYRAEILVVADTHSPLLMDVASLCRAEGVTYLEHDAGYHDWGYPGLQYGYEWASGSHLLNIGDDDVYVPGAFEMICRAIEEVGVGPVMFRAELHPSPNRGNTAPVVLWSEKRLAEKVITGQNLATPNVPGKIGGWENDWRHAEDTVAHWDGLVTWREEVICRCY
jgi:hypothetical protein